MHPMHDQILDHAEALLDLAEREMAEHFHEPSCPEYGDE
jgi:hypothetical protein